MEGPIESGVKTLLEQLKAAAERSPEVPGLQDPAITMSILSGLCQGWADRVMAPGDSIPGEDVANDYLSAIYYALSQHESAKIEEYNGE